MNNTQQLLDALGRVHQAHPSWRFGQLIANVSMFAEGPVKSAVYDVEDEELLKAAQDHLARLGAGQQTEQVAV